MTDCYRFGDFELDPVQRSVRLAGQGAALGGRAFEVLLVLVTQRHRPVSKQELLDAVWPDRAVEEGNLAVHISALRRLLGPQAISTVPGQGYRFMLDEVAGAPAPATPAAPAPRPTLPAVAGPLIGRDDELQAWHRLRDEAALVSIVGIAGVGKTRLAVEMAQALTPTAPDDEAPCWVDLAELDEPALLALRIGARCGVPNDRAPDAAAALLQGLSARRLWIVLDNCEHLQPAVAELVEAALATAHGVRWLVTSQRPLKLAAERVLRLEPLALPQVDMALPEALACGALALLVRRAQAVDHRFTLSAPALPAAIALCQRLDGLPLALEMAAARLPWMGVQAVHDRLDASLRLLSDPAPGRATRRSSLQGALEWSYSLLGRTERAVLRRLAPLRGSFSLDTAQQLVADTEAPLGDEPAVDPWDAIDALGVLVERSLVQAQLAPGDAAPRYRLLEATRQFAAARLAEAGESAWLAQRHVQVIGALAASAGEAIWTLGDEAWLLRYEPELENLRAALDQAVTRRERLPAAALLGALGWLAQLLAGGNESRHWAPRAEALLDGATPAEAVALCHQLASSWRNSAPQRAVALFERALALADAAGIERRDRYRLHCGATVCLARLQRHEEAKAALDQAQALDDPEWPPRLRMLAQDAAGFVAVFRGDPPAAQQHFRAFQALARRAGADGGVTVAAHNLVDIALSLGQSDEAVTQGRALVEGLRRQRNLYMLGFALGNLGAALLQQGHLDEAAATCLEALPHLRREQHAAWLFDHLALLALRRARPADALRLQAYGERLRAQTQSVRDPGEQRAWQQVVEGTAAWADDPQRQACRAEGEALDAEAADALARRLL